MKKKYCTCIAKGLQPEIDEKNKCMRCGKKVYSSLDAYNKIRRTTLVDTRTQVKRNDKIYDRKKSKQELRRRQEEEI